MRSKLLTDVIKPILINFRISLIVFIFSLALSLILLFQKSILEEILRLKLSDWIPNSWLVLISLLSAMYSGLAALRFKVKIQNYENVFFGKNWEVVEYSKIHNPNEIWDCEIQLPKTFWEISCYPKFQIDKVNPLSEIRIGMDPDGQPAILSAGENLFLIKVARKTLMR